MTLQNIDTFEQDVAQELKKKEATMRKVATAANDVKNVQPVAKKTSLLPVVLVFFFLLILIAGGTLGYLYYERQQAPAPVAQQAPPSKPELLAKSLAELSPRFPDAMGIFVTDVKKNENGYTLTLSAFSPIYSYMLKNESVYADDVAKALGVPKAVKGDLNILPVATPPTPKVVVIEQLATTTSTSTKGEGAKMASTTKATTKSTSTPATTTPEVVAPIVAPEPEPVIEKDMTPVPFTFSDMTLFNQNMRVGASGGNTIYYAFIENKALVFSKTPDGIISLKNAILR
jgi:hypothetical protein